MINLAVGVLTHPARAERLDPLLLRLNADNVFVAEDGGKGYWGTARDAWLSAPSDCTHFLLLQDDVLPVLDLLLGLRVALEQRPLDVVSLFSASRRLIRANAEGYAWAIGRSLSWSQGIVLPRQLIQPWIEWTDDNCRPTVKSHDARLSAFLLIAEVPVLYTVPCLVEHDAPNDSLIGNNRSEVIRRVAGIFPGEEWSALTQDWTAGAEYPYKLATPGKKAFAGIVTPDSHYAKDFE